MKRQRRFSEQTVHHMCDLMDRDGLSAAQVGDMFGISRAAVLGLRFRAGRSKPDKAPVMAEIGQTASKPCLKCGSTAPRNKAHRICSHCKSQEIYSGMYGAF